MYGRKGGIGERNETVYEHQINVKSLPIMTGQAACFGLWNMA